MVAHRTDPKIVERAIALRKEGKTLRAIADIVGISDGAVHVFCKRAGVGPAGPARRPRATQHQVDRVIELREKGLSYPAVARIVGVGIGSVHYHCLKFGIAPPGSRRGKIYASTRCRRFTLEEDEILQALSIQGIKLTEMSRRTGRSQNSIRMRLYTLAKWAEAA